MSSLLFAFWRFLSPLTQPLSVPAPLCSLSLHNPRMVYSKSPPTSYWQVLAGKRKKACLHGIFSVIFNENCFYSLSFPAKLDMTTTLTSAKVLASRTNSLRISHGARYSHFLTGASWQDTHHPWDEACNTVGLCLHVFDSGKGKQKQILWKRRHFKSSETQPMTANAKKYFY